MSKDGNDDATNAPVYWIIDGEADLRARFAMAAMQGLLAQGPFMTPADMAEASVKCADALLDELGKSPQ